MKRIATLLLVAIFALGSVGVAQADGIDVKVKGTWDFAFGWADNIMFIDNVNRKGNRDDDSFISRQRIRTQVNFIASESLEGVLMFEIGDINWGNRGNGGAIDADQVIVEVKRAYLNWVVPNTPIAVRMGVQGLKLPSTPLGSPVWDADTAGVVVSSPVASWNDIKFGVTAFWARPFDRTSNDGVDDDGSGRSLDDEVDGFGLILPVSGKGWSFTPWGIYGFVGADSGFYNYLFNSGKGRGHGSWNTSFANENEHTKVWWVGAHFKLDYLDPLVFNLEGIYGRLNAADISGFNPNVSPVGGVGQYHGAWNYDLENISTSGWYLAATLDYKLDWGTPGIFGWWSSGDKANSNDSGRLGRMPVLGNDTGSFKPTSFGTAGKWAIDTDTVITGTGIGTWGAGVKLANVSFLQDLSHTLRVVYYRGTNDADLIKKGTNPLKYSVDGLYLTDEDSVWEINFDHTYKIYENLTAMVELGWLRLNSDRDTWKNVKSGRYGQGGDENSNAWKAQLLFQYKF